MGCDIHAMIELREPKLSGGLWTWWRNGGDPGCGRNYEIFAVLAGVRSAGQPRISDPRGVPDDATSEMEAWSKWWGSDAHSHSYVTLAEMKAFDVNQEWDNPALVLGRDETGAVTSTCAWTSGSHMGPVGKVKVFGTWGTGSWDALIAKLESVKTPDHTDDDVRLVFFFDN